MISAALRPLCAADGSYCKHSQIVNDGVLSHRWKIYSNLPPGSAIITGGIKIVRNRGQGGWVQTVSWEHDRTAIHSSCGYLHKIWTRSSQSTLAWINKKKKWNLKFLELNKSKNIIYPNVWDMTKIVLRDVSVWVSTSDKSKKTQVNNLLVCLRTLGKKRTNNTQNHKRG